jgi:hypothetical protein
MPTSRLSFEPTALVLKMRGKWLNGTLNVSPHSSTVLPGAIRCLVVSQTDSLVLTGSTKY